LKLHEASLAASEAAVETLFPGSYAANAAAWAVDTADSITYIAANTAAEITSSYAAHATGSDRKVASKAEYQWQLAQILELT